MLVLSLEGELKANLLWDIAAPHCTHRPTSSLRDVTLRFAGMKAIAAGEVSLDKVARI